MVRSIASTALVIRLATSGRGQRRCRVPASSGLGQGRRFLPMVLHGRLLCSGMARTTRLDHDSTPLMKLGHLVMHHEPEFSDQVQERQAHAFAAALLMPAEVIVDHLPRRPPRAADWDQLKAAQRRWGVSVAALLYRARELGTLPEAGFRRAMTRYNQLGLRAVDGQALGEPERPRLLAEAVETLLTHKAWTLDDLAEALLFTRRQLQQILGEIATENEARGDGREAGDVVVPFRRAYRRRIAGGRGRLDATHAPQLRHSCATVDPDRGRLSAPESGSPRTRNRRFAGRSG